MGFNINAAERYASKSGRKISQLSDKELSLFELDKNGNFVHDNKETREWNSVFPKHREKFYDSKNFYVYIVQSIEPIYKRIDGSKERRTYGLFFRKEDALDFIEKTELDPDTVDIISCHKRDFRKSIWGWDVDGTPF